MLIHWASGPPSWPQASRTQPKPPKGQLTRTHSTATYQAGTASSSSGWRGHFRSKKASPAPKARQYSDSRRDSPSQAIAPTYLPTHGSRNR